MDKANQLNSENLESEWSVVITKKEKQIIRKVNIPEAIIEEIQIPEKKISIKSKTEKIKMSRQPTAYNLFFKENYDSTSGTPQERMKQIAEMYNRHKEGKSIHKKPIDYREDCFSALSSPLIFYKPFYRLLAVGCNAYKIQALAKGANINIGNTVGIAT